MRKKLLKIGILIDQLVPGGVQKDAANEVFYLNKFGHKAKLLVLMRKGYLPKYQLFFPKVPTEFLSDNYPILLKNSFKFPIFTFFSTLHILSPLLAPLKTTKGSFDIIVAHGTTTCLTALSLWKKNRIPYIAIINDPMEYILKKVYAQTLLRFFFWLLSPILFYLEKRIIENAKVVVVLSATHLPYIQKKYNVTAQILLPGNFPLTKLPSRRKDYLIASSRWETGKNPDLLLTIMQGLPKTRLVIAGNWTNKKDLVNFRRKIGELNLSSQISLKTDILPRNLTQLYRGALAWIHPNVEAFGLGGFEAASCGCPVVMPAGSGLAQILKDKKDGFFPENASAREFIKPLKMLINSPDTAYQMGKSAWNTLKKDHSWQNHTRQLESLITDSLSIIKVLALETGHAQGTVISGGDKLLEEMSTYLSPNIRLSVVIPKMASWHWRNRPANVTALTESILDKSANSLLVFINYLLRILKTTKIILFSKNKDVIYSSTNVFPDVVPAYFAKLLNPKIKWFARIHHLSAEPHKRPGILLVNLGAYFLQEISMAMLHQKADLIAALNPNLAKILIMRNFPREKLVIVSAGIDIKAWHSTKKWTKTIEAIYLGRLHPSKGIFDLAPIWKKVTNSFPQARLVIVGLGTPPILNRLKRQIKKENLGKNIEILGPLSENQVHRCLNLSKIFLFTDHEAGFGLAATEAMAVGLPTVGYDIGILGNVFKQGFIKIKPFDTDNFAGAIISLLTNHEKFQYLSLKARSEAQKHDWQKVTKNFEKLLINLK